MVIYKTYFERHTCSQMNKLVETIKKFILQLYVKAVGKIGKSKNIIFLSIKTYSEIICIIYCKTFTRNNIII